MSERLYALLLQWYPAAFRERYADEMSRVFRERLRDESAARVWLDVLLDAVVSIPRQHCAQRPDPILPPSAAPLYRLRSTWLLSFLAGGFVAGAVGGLSVVTLAPWQSVLVMAAMLGALAVPARAMCRLAHRIRQPRADVQGDAITVCYEGFPPLTLQRPEVIAIDDRQYLGLRIKAADPERDLWVPITAPSYAAVKAAVSNWAPLEVIPFWRGGERRPSGPFHLVVLCVASLFAPVTWPLVGIALGLTIVAAVEGVAWRGLSIRRRLASVAPLAVVLIRWVW
jgi:hypothetical protein